ncbi:MAG: hypothetical protein WBQ18_04545 [Solirubrobacteraceae bacterium]
MQPLAVDPRILRTVLAPEIKIVPGRALMARVVVADGNGRGSLSIAGFVLDAELPRNVRTGEDLRLVVREVSPERVLLSMSDDRPAAAPQAPVPDPPPAAIAVPLPQGGTVAVAERDTQGGQAGGGGSHSVALSYAAPSLGAVDLRFTLDQGSLRLAVSVGPGPALALAQADAENLRQTLADQLGRAVSVTVTPRREPLDLYA